MIGDCHPKWDERPLLIVQLKAGEKATREDILKFMDGKIAKWWMHDDVASSRTSPHRDRKDDSGIVAGQTISVKALRLSAGNLPLTGISSILDSVCCTALTSGNTPIELLRTLFPDQAE